MHFFGRFDERELASDRTFDGHGVGHLSISLINRATGSVHTGLSMNELQPGGSLHPHVHSFEKGFYILEGEPVVTINGASHRLRPGDFGCIKVGTPNAWHAGASRVRWLQMAAPQPKPAGAERDTFFLKARHVPADAPPLDLSDLKGNLLG